MLNLPSKLIEALNHIADSASHMGMKAYLHGHTLHRALRALEYKGTIINVVLCCKNNFDITLFYSHLTKKLTINKQLENSQGKYVVVAKPYVFDFDIVHSLDDASKDFYFSLDGLLFDLHDHQIKDLTGRGQSDISSQPVILKSLKPKKDWTIKEVLSFPAKSALFDAKIDDQDQTDLRSIYLSQCKNSDLLSNREILLDILLSERPGKALSVILEIFKDGHDWLINALIELSIYYNIALSEDLVVSEIISSNKLELIDVYNEFFLFEKTDLETPEQRKKRLTTSMRLLLDSPSINITTPYIDNVSVLTSAMLEQDDEQVRAFEVQDCPPYGCPECFPEKCDPPCCCCHSIDVVSKAKAQCHKQIVLSCNAAGDGPGPSPCNAGTGDGCFPDDCDQCREACDIAIAGTSAIVDCAVDEQTWWTLPPKYSPCDCFCREGYERPNGVCDLTCVTCNDLFCNSNITVDVTSDCHYNLSISPSSACCGIPATLNWMFVIDYSGSTTDDRQNLLANLEALIDEIIGIGGLAHFGLTVFGHNSQGAKPFIFSDFTSDYNYIKSNLALPNGVAAGSQEFDLQAVYTASQEASWETGSANYILLLADEQTQVSSQTADRWVDNAIIGCKDKKITVFVIDSTNAGPGGPPSPHRLKLATETGGTRYAIGQDFGDIVDQLNITAFPSACECLDQAQIPIRRAGPDCICCKDGDTQNCIDDPFDIECLNQLKIDRPQCFEMPIRRCVSGQDCSDPEFCKQETAINVCGNLILITPERVNMVCCSDVGTGCSCGDTTDSCDLGDCCGPTCVDTLVCDQSNNQNTLLYPDTPEGRRLAKQEVWCHCFSVAAYVDDSTSSCSGCCCPDPDVPIGDPDYPCGLLDPSDPQQAQLLNSGICCDCADVTSGQLDEKQRQDCCNCCLHFSDGIRDPQTQLCGFTKVRCKPEVDSEVDLIFDLCSQGGGGGGVVPPPPFDPTGCPTFKCPQEDENIKGDPEQCASTRNPSVVVLNNGIGLVAYEDMDTVSVIRIKQFHTGSSTKLLPNREFNFGRLQNYTKWSNNIARFYFYEDLPESLLTIDDEIDPDDPKTWTDGIAFKNGPLAHKCFAVLPPVKTDENGDKYIQVVVPSTPSFTEAWPSNDDVYDIKWFLFDFEDTGLVGCSPQITSENYRCNNENTSRKDDLISQSAADQLLLLNPHIYNGRSVPTAKPSIATASNYSNSRENAQFVYLAYQALEDEKWNVYLQQIRLSEYQRESIIENQGEGLVSLADLNISHLIYRIVCTNDSCETYGDHFLLKREVVMEAMLEDGREVFNQGYSGNWPALCPGYSDESFEKKKVFVHLVHSVVADRCPNQFVFDDIFYDWQSGQAFTVPAASINPLQLFELMRLVNDSCVSVGVFDEPVTISDVNIVSSSISAIWYDDPSVSTWSTVSDNAFSVLTQFIGFDISEPILLTQDEVGHSMRPVVKVNYNNQIFVCYENTNNFTTQVKLTGTHAPITSIPTGYLDGRDLERELDYFIQPGDFVYSTSITQNEGINQSPDLFIDLNDVLHIVWQSNRDNYWEIYYSNSSDDFSPVRITNYQSKSLKPSIDGGEDGSLYIVWHDDRFGNYEIMMAYNLADRIVPLFQQDPYLASLRNSHLGWRHTTDRISFLLTNTSSSSQCYQNFSVNFYGDRLLEQESFQISNKTFPFAFTLPSAQQEESTFDISDMSRWTSVIIPEFADPYYIQGQTTLSTSPEIDTYLNDSTITKVQLPALNADCSLLTLEARASNTRNDTTSEWSSPVSVAGMEGNLVDLQTLGISDIIGRYQQIRLRYECSSVVETYSLLENNDDAFTTENLSWSHSSVVKFGYDGSASYNGYLRFRLNLDPDSIILSAKLSLVSASDNSGETKARIKLIDSDNALPFTASQVLNLEVETSASDTYDENGIGKIGADSETKIRVGTDSLNAVDYNGYFRFPMPLPKDTIISSAYLKFVANATNSGNCLVVVRLIDEKNAAEFPHTDTTTIEVESDMQGTTWQNSNPDLPYDNGISIDTTSATAVIDISPTNVKVPWPTRSTGFTTEIVDPFPPDYVPTPWTWVIPRMHYAFLVKFPDGSWGGPYYQIAESPVNYLWTANDAVLILTDGWPQGSKIYIYRSNSEIDPNVNPSGYYFNYYVFDVSGATQRIADKVRLYNEHEMDVNINHGFPSIFKEGLADFNAVNTMSVIGIQRAYYRFDLSSLPTNSIIESVTFSVYQETFKSIVDRWLISQFDAGQPFSTTALPSILPGTDVPWTTSTSMGWITSPNLYSNESLTGYLGYVLRWHETSTGITRRIFRQKEAGGTLPYLSIQYTSGLFPTVTSSSVSWNIADWTSGVTYRSDTDGADLKDLVDEWFSLQDNSYDGGNYIGFKIEPVGSTSYRDIVSYDGGSLGTTRPVLVVNYESGIPDEVAGGILWTTSGWSSLEDIESPDISSLVQNYIARSPLANSYMGLVFRNEGSASLKEFVSQESSNINSAKLVVTYGQPIDWSVSVVSQSPPRICLLPGETSVGYLDLTPRVRVDQQGLQLSEMPLPINYIPNWTYFIEAQAETDDGTIVIFGDQKLSVSCQNCFRNTSTWNSISCSVQISIENTSTTKKYYNVSVKFYTDKQYTMLEQEINTIDNPELFTFGDLNPSTTIKTNLGYEVLTEHTLELLCWPQLSPTTALLCGIKYYISIDYCASDDIECNTSDMIVFKRQQWVCDCSSSRWDGVFENAPISLFSMNRWRSSAFGVSDTRLTETGINVYNTNPVVKIKTNRVGVVLYESNREGSSESEFRIYASVYSVSPSYNMYASATEFITSASNEIHPRSDIPICGDDGCYDEYGKVINPSEDGSAQAMLGRSPSFAIDQFNSIFLAVETPFNSSICTDLVPNQQQSIRVHRCGVDDYYLFGYNLTDSGVESAEACSPKEITGQTSPINTQVLNTIVRLIRVSNSDVAYHVSRGGSSIPVVTKCDIKLEIVGSPESVAIRLKNSNQEDWSEWQAFEPQIGDYTISIDWALSTGSGLKTVSFQVATYSGLTSSASVSIIADYNKTKYDIAFFKPIPGVTPLPGEEEAEFTVPEDATEVWSLNNRLNTYSGYPVAAIRPIEIDSAENIVIHNSDYIFFEITPELSYFQGVEKNPPTIDFVSQGKQAALNISTYKRTRDGQTVFRGKIQIDRDGISTAKDGLAYIIPHFDGDCLTPFSVERGSKEPYVRDLFNTLGSENRAVERPDVWASERDSIGQIKYATVIRPNEDPYLIFGDPDYRLKERSE